MEWQAVLLLICSLGNLASSFPQSEEKRAFDKLIAAEEKSKKFGSESKVPQIPISVLERNSEYNIVMVPASIWACTGEVIAIDNDPYKDWQERFGSAIGALGANQDTVTSKMFKRLFQYIVGVNSKSASIEMTAPVTNKVLDNEEGSRSTEMCFWLGEEYNAKNPAPEPIQDDVYIQKRPPTIYFVKRFSGWALSNKDWESKLGQLRSDLEGREEVDDTGVFFTVSFDSPFHNGADRRNEIWIPKKEGVSLRRSQLEKAKYESLNYIVREKTSQYELREYPAETWACTRMEDINPEMDPMNDWQSRYDNNPIAAMSDLKYKSEDRPANDMFMRMFRYIQGVNDRYEKIDMTIPVPTTHNTTSNKMESQEMCFWLGSKYRSNKNNVEPPIPIPSLGVQIGQKKGFTVFVREFGGWAMADKDYRQEYMKLKEDLNLVAERFDQKLWQHVSYNSPWEQNNRRNEVWIPQV